MISIVIYYFKLSIIWYIAKTIAGIEVLKYKEGINNRVYLLIIDNRLVVFAKLPNLSVRPAFYTTASEVATYTFVSVFLIRASSLNRL